MQVRNLPTGESLSQTYKALPHVSIAPKTESTSLHEVRHRFSTHVRLYIGLICVPSRSAGTKKILCHQQSPPVVQGRAVTTASLTDLHGGAAAALHARGARADGRAAVRAELRRGGRVRPLGAGLHVQPRRRRPVLLMRKTEHISERKQLPCSRGTCSCRQRHVAMLPLPTRHSTRHC